MCSRWTSTHIHEKSADILDVRYVDSYELVIVLQTNLLTVITTDQLVDAANNTIHTTITLVLNPKVARMQTQQQLSITLIGKITLAVLWAVLRIT
jgi:hypothetical protein